ncbi:MAG: nucleotidyltransferase substrate binding protein [Methanobrevibacter sp.]|nr:nucleotidyltransferase substrate binding protein [Methanobrevibacter sp.]
MDDFHKWEEFHNPRNLSSHVYGEEIAKETYTTAKEFDSYLKKFISILKEKIQDI